jgi:hypothetical protein
MSNRTDLLATLREATKDDLWLTRFALLRLTEDVDLGCLVGLVDAVLTAAEARETEAAGPEYTAWRGTELDH